MTSFVPRPPDCACSPYKYPMYPLHPQKKGNPGYAPQSTRTHLPLTTLSSSHHSPKSIPEIIHSQSASSTHHTGANHRPTLRTRDFVHLRMPEMLATDAHPPLKPTPPISSHSPTQKSPATSPHCAPTSPTPLIRSITPLVSKAGPSPRRCHPP